jgi:hypothetical protein
MAVVTQFPTANEAGLGVPWTNPNNAHADDGVLTTGTGTVVVDNFYKTFGFDAVIPAGSTITAVKAICEHNDKAVGTITQSQPIIAGVQQTLRDFTNRTVLTVDTNDHTADRAWVRADLLDANFKMRLRGDDSFVNNVIIDVDYIKVEVTYTPPGPTGVKPGTTVITRQAVNRGSTF